MRVFVCLCVCACVCAYVCACVCACVCVCVCVSATVCPLHSTQGMKENHSELRVVSLYKVVCPLNNGGNIERGNKPRKINKEEQHKQQGVSGVSPALQLY